MRTCQLAAEAITHPHRDLRGGGSFIGIALNHFKVMIESRNLIHLGHGDVHLLGQRHDVAVVQGAVGVV